MIVRILTEGQFEVDDSEMDVIEQLDEALFQAIESDDEDAFTTALDAVHDAVRAKGKLVDHDQFLPSDLVVPHAGSTIEEIRKLLTDDESLADKDAPAEATEGA